MAPASADRAGGDQAQPQPSDQRPSRLSAALSRTHREGRAGRRSPDPVHRGFHQLRPRLLRTRRSGVGQSALGAGDHRGDRQAAAGAQSEGSLGRLAGRLLASARRDRSDLSRGLQGLQRPLPQARRLPAAQCGGRAGLQQGGGRQGQVLHPHGPVRHRLQGRAGRAAPDDGALQRPVQHHRLRL